MGFWPLATTGTLISKMAEVTDYTNSFTVLFTMTPPKYKPAFNLEKQATGIFGHLTGISSDSHNNLEKQEGLGPSYWFKKHPGCTLSGFRNVTAGGRLAMVSPCYLTL